MRCRCKSGNVLHYLTNRHSIATPPPSPRRGESRDVFKVWFMLRRYTSVTAMQWCRVVLDRVLTVQTHLLTWSSIVEVMTCRQVNESHYTKECFLTKNVSWQRMFPDLSSVGFMPPGSAFIKPDQLDPWIKDHIHDQVWNEITYSFLQYLECINNVMPQCTGHVVVNPYYG